MKCLFCIIFITFSTICLGQKGASVIKESRYFEFHSDFLINLHHFLYQQAKGDQVAHLKEDGNLILDIGVDSVFQHTIPKSQEIWLLSTDKGQVNFRTFASSLNNLKSSSPILLFKRGIRIT